MDGPAAPTPGDLPRTVRVDDAGAVRPGPRVPRQRGPVVEEFSAGGLVVDLTATPPVAALIGRSDREGRRTWSLPKGHVEPGETRAQTAVREVEEETGIRGRIVAELGEIDFWFAADGRRVHKRVLHHLLVAEAGSLGSDDPEVSALAWVPLPDLVERLTYADERRLAEQALVLLEPPT